MAYQKLSRKSGPRRALLRSQVTALLKEGRLETTAAKAKAVRPLAEQMITLAKKGGLHARRQALAFLYDEDVVTNLFEKIGPRFEGREGGYTRIINLGHRRGDGAPMVILELIS
ncbi:MAG TPA: 50S ribosomal protein L17 [Bacillota bacterium]|jgi:large subunit ribosomal protein L17|nr:50S ribosomal protein L17 [Bacillota bacterium]HOB86575.1 50S ribosomal protein L17 [Bacillota bacterium]HOP68316.1 50S ribosomal protein L17 [Bacillota bacterium]HPT33983.1 50S ribosomal protein L17 [Bacillota bacterium]HPZ64687.1 50S ribosomal protein L17 [Bacillota bacterium]